MSKASVIHWGPEGDREIDMDVERRTKLEEMLAQGKTTTLEPLSYDQVTLTATRVWVDTAAAQEYIDFINVLAPKYGKTIVSATIIDVA